MSTKLKVTIVIVTVLSSYALGRYTAPVKIQTETKIVEVEKKVQDVKQDVSKDTHKKTTVVVERDPSGASKTTTTIDEDTDYDKKTKSDTINNTSKLSDTKKIVEKEKGHTTIMALSGININSSQKDLAYGLGVNRTILGPIAIGVFGMTNGIAGCSVGLEF